MKKLLVLAMMATLLMAGSAFAVQRLTPAPNATFSFGAPGFAGGGVAINCSGLAGGLNPTLVAAVRSALTTGVYNPGGSAACPNAVGGVHANAIGYVTIDVASNCSLALPTDPLYYSTSILFD